MARLAGIGYSGVETYLAVVTEDAAKIFKALGLEVVAAHAPLPLGENKTRSLESTLSLGCSYLVVPSLPRENFTSLDGIKKCCDQLNEADELVRANGLTLAYHD